MLAHLDAQTTTALDLNQERARLAKIQAEKIEFEVARLRGSLLDADAVERVLSRLFVDLRTRLLHRLGYTGGHSAQCAPGIDTRNLLTPHKEQEAVNSPTI